MSEPDRSEDVTVLMRVFIPSGLVDSDPNGLEVVVADR